MNTSKLWRLGRDWRGSISLFLRTEMGAAARRRDARGPPGALLHTWAGSGARAQSVSHILLPCGVQSPASTGGVLPPHPAGVHWVLNSGRPQSMASIFIFSNFLKTKSLSFCHYSWYPQGWECGEHMPLTPCLPSGHSLRKKTPHHMGTFTEEFWSFCFSRRSSSSLAMPPWRAALSTLWPVAGGRTLFFWSHVISMT